MFDETRVKYKVRRAGEAVFIDLWFDDCPLNSRIVVGGDEQIALMVESGELRLTKDSKLVYEDGTPYHCPGDKIAKAMCVW